MKINTNTNTNTGTVTSAVRELHQSLTGLGKVMGKNPPGPALGCVQVTADGTGDTLLTATDGETFATVRLAGGSHGQTEFLLPAGRLRELVKPANPSGVVTLSPSGEGVEVTTGTQLRTIASPPPSAFPREPQFRRESLPLPPGATRGIVCNRRPMLAVASISFAVFVLASIRVICSAICLTRSRHSSRTNAGK